MNHRIYNALIPMIFCLIASACQKEKPQLEKIHDHVSLQLDSLYQQIEQNLLAVLTSTDSQDSLQCYFLQSRLHYKKIEHLMEYYAAGTTRFINGPPLDDLEVEEYHAFDPQGFQVLEEMFFPWDSIYKDEAIRHTRILLANINRLRTAWDNTVLTEAHLFDASRLQVFRILSLGLSGFDSPIAKNSLEEAAASLHGMQEIFLLIETDKNKKSLSSLWIDFKKAEAYLLQNNDFNTFDRARFIIGFANPLSRSLAEARDLSGFLPVHESRLLDPKAVTFFDENVFRADHFSSSIDDKLSDETINLGRALFFDDILSENSNRSCASCHQPQKAFTDGLSKSLSLSGSPILRNTPTLLNSAFQNSQFYDMRSNTLETQARDVVENANEMHGSLSTAAIRLQQYDEYRSLFSEAFHRDSITPADIQFALASYIRSLKSFNTPFDKYMRGDTTQLSRSQVEGFNLFMGKAQCGICHFLPLFNGTVPPFYAETESEVIGVPSKVEWKNATIDNDSGRYGIYKMEQLMFAFKTPTVRNAGLTAPYMHNGVYKNAQWSLQDA
jgi:cytochrome c peroxidase